MTIQKGDAWGEPAADLVPHLVARSDREVAELAHRSAGAVERPVIGLDVGGGGGRSLPDIARTLGVAARRPPADRIRFTFDLGYARLDGGPEVPFAAHVVARRWLWRGPFLVAMNAAFVGRWYLGPRAHPNDGLLDITDGALPAGQRLLARRRLETGAHLPHPGLSYRRRPSLDHRFERPIPVFVDGRRLGTARSVSVRVVPDRFTLVV